ncbi:hypothetical protein RAC89_14620 [Paenibacillus sp. GD4]|uniref:hypothetical protein n=1 Tax=Paenibacillus sp. GD4 TaxID=3068890 RepID=UPI00279645C3|nr:hypothetical protein [Paenibacillus sp. GD4]MDQ1911641.1 hypothetical protein [Paenibacillus sp. GD4]
MQSIIKNRFFLFIVITKLVVMALFSSDYQDKLFVPFVHTFLTSFDNPWEYYYVNNLPKSFPYPPLMLYILSVSYWIPYSFHLPVIIQNVFIKLPIFFADFSILYILYKIFPSKDKEIIYIYFASPIVLYASYMHSQLDLIPTAMLLISLYLLIKNKIISASVIYGLAITTKFHVIAALPIILLYLFKSKKPAITILSFIGVPVAMYISLSTPFLGSAGFYELVLFNAEQNQLFDVYFIFNNLYIYVAPFVILLIYARFAGYPKINNDLFFSSMGLLFSVFVLCVPPMPAWYLWVIPFISLYFINTSKLNARTNIILSYSLAFAYIIYFIFLHVSPISDINFLQQALNVKQDSGILRNLFFTILEACLLAIIYSLYKYGIKSNSVYKKKSSSFVVGVGGDSGSGKSTLLSDIDKLLNQHNVLHIEGDGDHKWERGDENWGVFTHLNPKANYLHRQADDLLAIKKGEIIHRVEYDHQTGKFTEPQKVSLKNYIVMAGLHPFYLPKMRKVIDLKIYLETDEKLRRHWKIIRDTKKRGYSIEKVIQQIEFRMNDAQKYIWPQKQFADLIINYYTENDFQLGDENAEFEIKLKITMDSSVDLEPLVSILNFYRIYIEHDYSEDLSSQFIVVNTGDLKVNFDLIIDQVIPNREEILFGESTWHSNHRGLVQIIILLMISYKMREYTENEL